MSDLEFLRKEAKTILKRCRAGDHSAIARMRAQLPRLATLEMEQLAKQIKLADVHHAFAREQGYASWAELKHLDSSLEQFLAAIRGGSLAAAKEFFDERPDLAEGSIHASCAIGDSDAVIEQLDTDRASATELRDGWPPILYACASPFNRWSPRHATGIIQCVSQLLEHGADPNTYTVPDAARPDRKVSCWYRAVMSGNIPLSLFLGSKGGRPAETPSEILEGRPDAGALMQHFKNKFGTPESRNQMMSIMQGLKDHQPPLRTMPPFQLKDVFERRSSPESVVVMFRGLLENGLDPNQTSPPDGAAPLHNAVVKPNPETLVELLLQYGANPNLRRADGKTPYCLAARAGNAKVLELLRGHGAMVEDAKPGDLLLGACLTANVLEAQSILSLHPDLFLNMSPADKGTLISVAATMDTSAMNAIVQLGFDLSASGESGATALHLAAWNGRVEMVNMLLQFRAPIAARDRTYDSSPLAWAAHGSKNCRESDEDYIQIVEALSHAGADWDSAVGRSDVLPEMVATPKVAAAIRSLCS